LDGEREGKRVRERKREKTGLGRESMMDESAL
jgi:hypothetical protein